MEDISSSRRAPFGTNPTVGEAGRATQQRILAAANEVLTEKGYARTSVEAITDRAGCSRPTFYQYFSGKEDLHRRLAARFGADLAELLDRMGPITADRAGHEELSSWLHGLSSVHDRYRAVADNFGAAVRTDDQMVAGSATLSAAYRERLVQVIVDPRDGDIPLEELAAAINAVGYGASLYRGRVGDVGEDRMTAALADMIHRSLFGPIAGLNVSETRLGSAPRPKAQASIDTPSDDGRQSRGVATRARLLAAASTAFATLGYEGVRVDDIATEAGVSHGTLYRYYPDKDAVFAEHVGAATAEITALLEAWPLAAGEEVLWTKEYYEIFARHGGIVACLPEARAAGLACAAQSRRQTAFALQRGLDARGFGDTDADVVICFALLEILASTAFPDSASLSIRQSTRPR